MQHHNFRNLFRFSTNYINLCQLLSISIKKVVRLDYYMAMPCWLLNLNEDKDVSEIFIANSIYEL